jgi:hypothetical protein
MLLTERLGRLRVLSADGKQMSEPVAVFRRGLRGRRGPLKRRSIRLREEPAAH